jgi:hypothetical protein
MHIMDNSLFSEDLLETVDQLLSNAAQKAKGLRAEADRATHFQLVWERLSSFLYQGWPLHILALMNKEAPLINEMRAENHPAVSALDKISHIAQEQTEVLLRRFPSYIEEACTKNNLPLDRESRHPKYKFESGFFQLEIDDRKGIARLSDNEGQLDEFPADIAAIIEAVQREHKRVFKRPFDGEKLLKKLRHQYLAVIKQQNKPDGTSIPIRHITRRLGKNEKGFRTDEFLIDLSRLVEQGPAEIDGYRFDLQQTKDTSQGMLLHGIAGRGYIGFITFRRVSV